ncbi:MAG: glycosyltransferase [Thermaerobacter sp.]|nr:glycosyltransferase [Thermaerobacter sp.]
MNWDIVLGSALGQGGLERVVATVGRTLRRRGHAVRILQAQPSEHPDWAQGLPLVHYDATAFGGMLRYEAEPDLLRWALGYMALHDSASRPDVILATHTPIFSLIARLAAGIGKDAPLILSWLHGPLAAYGEASPLLCADAHLAISRSVEASLHSSVLAGQPVFYIGNPVRLGVSPVRRPTRQAEFVYLGRLSPEKRLDRLLQAIARVTVPWRLTVFGDGPQAADMGSLAVSLGIADRVAWRGWQEDPWVHVESATALVLTSDYEGFGVAAAEALARGVPVVSSMSGGPEEFLRGGGGWLYPGEDIGKLAGILQELADGTRALPSPDLCRRAVRPYDPGLVVDRIEAAAQSARAWSLSR